MMKKLSLLICMLILPLWGMSQWLADEPTPQIAIGLKGGVNLAGMRYTDKHLSVLPQSLAIKPMGGVFVDIPFNHFMGIAPELLYVERGVKTLYTHYSDLEIDYRINARFVDLRLPLLVGIDVCSWFQPYLVLGADVGYLLGGRIHLTQPGMPKPDINIPIGKANMYEWYAGAFGGLGMRFFRTVNGKRAQFKMDAVYNYGLLDSFSSKEHDESSQPENINAYNLTGKRYHKGIEVTIGVIIPIFPDESDPCYNFSKNKYF